MDPCVDVASMLRCMRTPQPFATNGSQRTLFQAKSQYIQVLLDAHQAIAEIESILGHVVTHPAQQEKE